ncbi:receptor protein-tyrosine kinase CEPR1-like [Telopea speciosissima]|uniref:receptor protein-tyrosine kinase CEPR1-like n=1 Tax=Telopea speciosissima TaxID=54955 RepID=UPI001CC41A00|nr:receptor protein-tyrosine kinase CEPR1-like [Telopea speciosissima]
MMGLQSLILFLIMILFLSHFNPSSQATEVNQSHFFTLMKQSIAGKSLSRWDVEVPYCNYFGVGCNSHGDVVKIDVSGWSLSGYFPADVCSYLPQLRVLRLGQNLLHGKFPASIINCSLLEELNITKSSLTGTLPDFSPMVSLRLIDLSYNHFTGQFPMSVTNLSNLEVLNFNENFNFTLWQLPENISRLTKLKSMILSTAMVHGKIPPTIGNMTSLIDLELSGNYLVGQIPVEIAKLKNLQQLELYYNQLSGEIPYELGNLTQLIDLDMSVNRLNGTIPESLCKLPNLQVLQLYNNSLTGEIPSMIGNSTTLRILSLYDNSLSGKVPLNLGAASKLIALDLSENKLSGELPPDVCKGGKLMYFLVLQNQFSGQLPQTYQKCKSLLRFRVNSNFLQGSIPEELLGLPHASIIDLSSNNFEGPISRTIGNAKNLSELFIQRNRISGVIPPEISHAGNLVKIDLSNNLLSGPIPPEIGNFRKLNVLFLQGNRLNSSIPESLSYLKSLNDLDLSNNQLTGPIPESLCELLPNSINFSNNHLSGPVPPNLIKGGLAESLSGNPDLCVSVYFNLSDKKFPACPQVNSRKRVSCIWAVGISVVIVVIGAILFLKRWYSREKEVMEQDEMLSLSSFSYVQNFHKVSFDQHEIIEALVDKNIVGHGGSGTVYKIQLNNGEAVAVKKLWSQKTKDPATEDQLFLDRGLKTEVETLGSIRHKNIVKLYCYLSSSGLNLLVYEYLPNGNLWDALHRGRNLLDWPIRHRIALGIAQGLAYLHHDLMPPIIHRDIKSTNILLSSEYQAKVADFGVAKVLQARGGKDSTTTVIAGTYGYLAPEYAYSSRATEKCDVYSFGVVLMELITGKKPVEQEFGENKNIICWVSSCKVETKEGAMEVLDKRLSELYKDEMIQVLRIAIRCTCKAPALRPTMNEVVQSLIEADPCRFDSCKSSSKIK